MRNATRPYLGCVHGPVLGCSKPPPPIVPAEGIVRLDGRPLYKATVRFIPQIDCPPEYRAAVGVTDESGRYHLTCKAKPGAVVGPNQVLDHGNGAPPLPKDPQGHTIAGPYLQSLGGRPIPAKYANPNLSPLTADVKAGQTEYDFDLTR